MIKCYNIVGGIMKQSDINNFKLVLLPGAEEFGKRVNTHIKKILKTKKNFILSLDLVRFNNGEGKGKIKESDSVRNTKVYILQDITNSFKTYAFRGLKVPYSPDEHFQDITRAIGAFQGHAKEISVIMPFLYEGRQHDGNEKESLDCALSLQELVAKGTKRIITFDVHNKGVRNAIPLTEFKSIFPTNPILYEFLNNEDFDIDNLQIISPDAGATKRAAFYRDLFLANMGYFSKSRDLTVVKDGKNPIKEHIYVGPETKDKDVIVVDDMIDSGGSMIDTIRQIKLRGAKNIYVIVSFVLFTKGYEEFDKLYKEGILTKIYSTNLAYIPKDLEHRKWFHLVDCSELLAKYLVLYKDDHTLSALNKVEPKIIRKIEKMRKEKVD